MIYTLVSQQYNVHVFHYFSEVLEYLALCQAGGSPLFFADGTRVDTKSLVEATAPFGQADFFYLFSNDGSDSYSYRDEPFVFRVQRHK